MGRLELERSTSYLYYTCITGSSSFPVIPPNPHLLYSTCFSPRYYRTHQYSLSTVFSIYDRYPILWYIYIFKKKYVVHDWPPCAIENEKPIKVCYYVWLVWTCTMTNNDVIFFVEELLASASKINLARRDDNDRKVGISSYL